MRHRVSQSAMVAIAIAVSAANCFAESTGDRLTTAWHQYVDNARAFELAFPPDGRISSRTPHDVVIQNYESDDLGVGPKGRFYVEIRVLEPAETCNGMVERPRKVMIGKTQAVISLGEFGGDSMGLHFILCAVRKGHRFSVVVSENDAGGRIAKRILNSVRFLGE